MHQFKAANRRRVESELCEPAPALYRMNQLLEEQSRRIAHAVHHEAGQILAAVLMRLDETERELSPICGPSFEEIRQMLKQLDGQLWELSHDLRPSILDDFGLVPAIEFLVQRVSKRTGLIVEFRSSIEQRLAPEIETALYRVIQEALTNAAKHARAKTVQIDLSSRRRVLCSIRDDGAGFDLKMVASRKGDRGLGLLGMRERVELAQGSLVIQSSPGQGTEITVIIPGRSSKCP